MTIPRLLLEPLFFLIGLKALAALGAILIMLFLKTADHRRRWREDSEAQDLGPGSYPEWSTSSKCYGALEKGKIVVLPRPNPLPGHLPGIELEVVEIRWLKHGKGATIFAGKHQLREERLEEPTKEESPKGERGEPDL